MKRGKQLRCDIQDIGGPEENMANVLSGIFVKKFAKKFPKYKKMMYGKN